MKISFVLGIAALLIFASHNLLFSQEQSAQGEAMSEAQNEPQTQWVWGEVITADAQNKTLLVKYLDYDTDQEKEINITVDDKTTYENVNSIGEISPNDTVSIDYIVNADGVNVAKNISVEKSESQETLQPEEAPQEPEEGTPGQSEAGSE